MLSKEDHHDVAKHMGKALANKVKKATSDKAHKPSKDSPMVRVHVQSKTPGVYRSGADTISTKRGNTKMQLSSRPNYI